MADENPSPPENFPLGVLLTLLAFLAVAIMSAFAKAASISVASGVLVFFQNAISLGLLLPWVLFRGVRTLKTRRPGLHLVRAVTGMLSQYLFFVALKYIPLVDAVLLVNAAPLFIPLVVWIWLGTRIGGRLWLSLGIGFVGVLLILQPGRGALSWAAVVALAAGFFSAVALVAVSRLHTTDRPLRVLFYYFLLSSILASPIAISDWRVGGSYAWLWLLGVGAFMVLAQLLLILAYVQASPARVSPFNYSVVVFAGLIDWLIWRQAPNLLSAAGVLLVCVGGILSTIQHHRAHPRLSPRRLSRLTKDAD
jgi:drug/metabolite transporter (DMT)-like permease